MRNSAITLRTSASSGGGVISPLGRQLATAWASPWADGSCGTSLRAAPRSSRSEEATASWLPRSLKRSAGGRNRGTTLLKSPRAFGRCSKSVSARRAVWHTNVSEALEVCGGAAIIISNELVDAFPCRVFKKDGDGWRELALRIEENAVVEEWISAALPTSTVFSEPWPVGQRVEVHESFRVWLRAWLPGWDSGVMLTIDYGDTCPALYRRRPRGNIARLRPSSATRRPGNLWRVRISRSYGGRELF